MGEPRLILLDTHVAVWLALEPKRISAAARREIEDAETRSAELCVCDISLLELAILESKRRFQPTIGFDAFLRQMVERFTVLPISVEVCSTIAKLPSGYPKDPADRIIGATAWVGGMPLITADRKILKTTAFQTIW
jgi:PIN domain nuclease of toxin-antitoxin system